MRFLILLLVTSQLGNWAFSDTISEITERERVETKLRFIGHQILLLCGDTTSIVMPIQEMDGVYRLSFENSIEILPQELVDNVNQSVAAKELPERYLMYVRSCDDLAVVYSYERDTFDALKVQCGQRMLPLGCYLIDIRFLDTDGNSTSSTSLPFMIIGLILLGVVIAFLLYKYLFKTDSSQVKIGRYRFNTKAMYLIYEGERVQMTTRESDLLLLLYKSINNTVKKEKILSEIWDDEGSYDGRTLDVFISKLRKKLASDPRVKLVNVKGVGYKMVIED